MCKGIEAYTLKTRIETLIYYLREEGVSEDQIAERVAKKFDVTVEYVKELMLPKGSIRKTTTEVMIKSLRGRLFVCIWHFRD